MGQKLKFVLSDLHLGAGYAGRGGNHLEDFIADRQLVDFLHQVWHESERDQREVELIINGDCFEFLQVPAVDYFDPTAIYPSEAYLDSSQEASVQRLNIIAQGHPDVFNALSDFMHVESPQRRITVIKGNHDVHLIWPGVKSRLREILGASGTRASLLLFADEFVSREKIYVEHGHQRTEQFNAYNDFFNPRASDDPSQLFYPGGSRFMIDTLNDIEREHWFVDHIKPLTTLIWYAFHWDFDLAGQMLVRFVNQTCSSDETEPAPVIQDLADPDKRGQMARRHATDPAFRLAFHQQLQRYLRLANSESQEREVLPPPAVVDDPLAIGQACQQQQQTMLCRAAELVADREGAQAIIFGHTHTAVQQQLGNGSTYINTGSWIEDFSDASPAVWETLFAGTLQLVDGSPDLSYARIDYDDNHMPTAKLMFFSQVTDDVSRPETTKGFVSWLGRIFRKS